MRLYVARHAEAGPGSAGADDQSRVLTGRGHAQALGLGLAFAGGAPPLEVRPEVVICSPVLRAHETARLAAEALGLEPLVDERLGLGGSVASVEAVIREHEVRGTNTLLLIGHNPTMTEMLLRVDPRASSLRLAECAVLDRDGATARLLGRVVMNSV